MGHLVVLLTGLARALLRNTNHQSSCVALATSAVMQDLRHVSPNVTSDADCQYTEIRDLIFLMTWKYVKWILVLTTCL